MYSTRTFLFLKNKGFTREELLTILRGLGGEENVRMDSTRRELRTLLRTLPQEKRVFDAAISPRAAFPSASCALDRLPRL